MANRIGWDVIIHSGAGLVALVAGGLMGASDVARGLFSVLMAVSAISAILISWRHAAWVTGHWLAMLPVIGIGIGFSLADWGYDFAYATLWIAFLHFLYRGWLSQRAQP